MMISRTVRNVMTRVVVIVSEADLLRKEEYQDEQDAPHWLERRHQRVARSKAAGRTAAEVMSTPVITVDPDATVPMAARLLARHGIKRLPVVDDQDRLVGIVSRADLLRLFLRDDEAIHREILDEVLLRALWIDPAPWLPGAGRCLLRGDQSRPATSSVRSASRLV